MNIVCPHRGYNVGVRQVLEKLYHLHVDYKYMEHVDSYWGLMRGLWEEGETFIVIEHDVLPWPGAIQELQNCSEDWCSFTYEMKNGYGIYHAFGCTKFGKGLIEALPDAWMQIEDHNWNRLDSQFCKLALMAGLVPHPHRPPVIHFRDLLHEPPSGLDLMSRRKL